MPPVFAPLGAIGFRGLAHLVLRSIKRAPYGYKRFSKRFRKVDPFTFGALYAAGTTVGYNPASAVWSGLPRKARHRGNFRAVNRL